MPGTFNVPGTSVSFYSTGQVSTAISLRGFARNQAFVAQTIHFQCSARCRATPATASTVSYTHLTLPTIYSV